ncbi:MAG: hypothetical protein KAW12_22305 [Candidatus Aminicenantes bacterium]|nr:hypothetical protein [Candidatus Aminicenantes bacterium]
MKRTLRFPGSRMIPRCPAVGQNYMENKSLFTESGKRTHPMRGLRISTPPGLAEKFVFLTNFQEVLTKRQWQ